jgi:hypothetical protein
MDWKKCRFPYLKETVRYCKRIPNTYIAQKHKLRPKVVEKTISCTVGQCHVPELATERYVKVRVFVRIVMKEELILQ